MGGVGRRCGHMGKETPSNAQSVSTRKRVGRRGKSTPPLRGGGTVKETERAGKLVGREHTPRNWGKKQGNWWTGGMHKDKPMKAGGRE